MVNGFKRFRSVGGRQLTLGIIIAAMGLLPWGTVRSEVVQDLRYGVALYHFFQQDYFDSLTEIMVAEEQNALPHHQHNARLLTGGMSLSYGMSHQAETIFNELLVDITADSETNSRQAKQKRRAWFYLAKLYYQRGEDQKALAALSHVKLPNAELLTADAPIDAISDEQFYMQASILLRGGDLEAAQSMALGLVEQSAFKPYVAFNEGAYLAAQQRWDEAIERFSAVAMIEPTHSESQEVKLLRDKSRLAAGYSLLAHELPARAVEQFKHVRKESPFVNQALLGYGWAELKRQNYRGALVPWQHLQRRSLLLPAVQEVYLAVPYAYEQLGEPSAALLAYQESATRYQQAMTKIERAINRYQDSSMAELFDWPEQGSDDWLIIDEVMPATGSAPFLSELLAKDRFQRLLKDYRSLLTMQRQLSETVRRAQVLTFVDQEQQLLWQSVLQGDRYSQYIERYQQLKNKQQTLQKMIAAAQQDNSGLNLLDENQQDLLRRIRNQQQALPRLIAAGEASNDEALALKRYEGLLIWQASEQFIGKRWDITKVSKGLDQQLLDVEARIASLDKVVASRVSSDQAPKITGLLSRAEQQQQKVTEQLLAQDRVIRQEAVHLLTQQHRQLTHFLAQAKLSVARLYDAASTGESL